MVAIKGQIIMNLSSFFASILAGAKTVLTDVQPMINLAEGVAPVVAATIPGAGPVIAAAESGISAVEAVAPQIAASAQAAIKAGEDVIAAGHPLVTQLEGAFSSLYHMWIGPSGTVVLTPKTTVATAPTIVVNAQ